MAENLETPLSFEELYLARGVECDDFEQRPAFTGDLFELDDRRFILVQHPCAMRAGSALLPRQLIATVAESNIPSDWSQGHYKRAFFPEVLGSNLAAHLDDLNVLTADQVEASRRIAILSSYGVNLLVQRWIYHCSRVVIPTMRIDQQTSGPFEEADLTGEIGQSLIDGGIERASAVSMAEAWLGEGRPSGRDRLASPQFRAGVRRDMRMRAKEALEQMHRPS